MRMCFEFNEKELRELMAFKTIQRKIWLGGNRYTVNITPTGETD